MNKRLAVSLVWFAFVVAIASPRSAQAQAQAPNITAPTPIGSIEVEYPAGAHGDAEVDLELLLAEDGTVAKADVKQGAPPFADAARVGAEKFAFHPATKNGIPVRARIAIRVLFHEPAPTPPPAPPPPPPEAPDSVTPDRVAAERRSRLDRLEPARGVPF